MQDGETTFTVNEEDHLVIDQVHARTDLSRTKIKDAMTKGAVWLSRKGKARRSRRAKAPCFPGDVISLYYNEQVLATKPPAPTLIEDKSTYSIWFKPPGLLSSGTRYGDHCSINRWVEKEWQRPVFLVHRLDRFATGLMVLAHSKQAAAHLSAQFKNRQTTKIYKVIVQGRVHQENPAKQEEDGDSFTINTPLDDKDAISHITPLEFSDELSLVSVQIETGRKHQIRRHLAGIGYPILGDRHYGDSRYPSMQLTAVELGFTCPTTDIAVSYELPAANHPALDKLDD